MATAPAAILSGPNLGVGFLEFERPLQLLHEEIDALTKDQEQTGMDLAEGIRDRKDRLRAKLKRLYSGLSPWETVLVARHPRRPLAPDYIKRIVADFCELHGDRAFGDDAAVITGFGRIAGHKVMLVAHNKGSDTKERIACNFGCAHPEGYRKALAKMKLAEKFGLPVVCFIDTQGAFPGIGAEERGISQAIAVNLMEMSRLNTPVVCVVIGEGGSGGALGIGVGDRVAMLQHSFYSVISPEGCAAILFKTGEQRQRAAESLKLTAPELKKLGIIDEIVDEPLGAAHRDPDGAAASLEKYLNRTLTDLKRLKVATLVKRRYERIRKSGSFFESLTERARAKAAMEASKSADSEKTSDGLGTTDGHGKANGNGSDVQSIPGATRAADNGAVVVTAARSSASKTSTSNTSTSKTKRPKSNPAGARGRKKTTTKKSGNRPLVESTSS